MSIGQFAIGQIMQAIHATELEGAKRKDMVVLCGREAWLAIKRELGLKTMPSSARLDGHYPEIERRYPGMLRKSFRAEIYGVAVLEDPDYPSTHWRVQRLPEIAHPPGLLTHENWHWDGEAWIKDQPTTASAQLGSAPLVGANVLCPLCGKEAEQFHMMGAQITSCECVAAMGKDAVAVDFSKLTRWYDQHAEMAAMIAEPSVTITLNGQPRKAKQIAPGVYQADLTQAAPTATYALMPDRWALDATPAAEVAAVGTQADIYLSPEQQAFVVERTVEKVLAEIQEPERGTGITHALLAWPMGDWKSREVLYEGTREGCSRHHTLLRRSKLPERFTCTRWLVEIRDLALVPRDTKRVIIGAEPKNAESLDGGEWSSRLRELQKNARDTERNQVMIDTSMWDD